MSALKFVSIIACDSLIEEVDIAAFVRAVESVRKLNGHMRSKLPLRYTGKTVTRNKSIYNAIKENYDVEFGQQLLSLGLSSHMYKLSAVGSTANSMLLADSDCMEGCS